MNLPIPRQPARNGGAPFKPWLLAQPAASLLPKRTTVARKKKLDKQREQQQKHQQPTDNGSPHDPAPDDLGAEPDGVIGEADQPPPPSDKPQA